ncbi:MAG: pyridoxal-dependent decarboxylase, partial [Pseudomonadota bacterium]
MTAEKAETAWRDDLYRLLGDALEDFLRFDSPDPVTRRNEWETALDIPMPEQGVGIEQTVDELCHHIVPNGSQVSKPGFTSFVTTGTSTIGALTTLAGTVASPQRFSLTPFNLLEEQSLRWLAELCGLDPSMPGIYSSGGSIANMLAVGAARQYAFERQGHDPAAHGINREVSLFASSHTHHTIKRAAGVLGLGRSSVISIDCDNQGRMQPAALATAIDESNRAKRVPIAIIGNAGTTNAGAIDDLRALGELAAQHNIWFHVDGAYGLPGILDPRISPLYDGITLADSVIVDPHKWLGAPTGIGATFVRDRDLLYRAFTQEPADYLQTAFDFDQVGHSLDNPGHHYSDHGVELSAPSRGITVWGLLREIGRDGMRDRIMRHNDMAQRVAERARTEPGLELLMQPTLSICCFR